MTERSMNRLLMNYLERLPGAMQQVELENGDKAVRCVYSPHSLRATTATLLLDAGEAIESVQDLLDHKHITTTQIYDKRRRSVRDSASHKVPLWACFIRIVMRSGQSLGTSVLVAEKMNTNERAFIGCTIVIVAFLIRWTEAPGLGFLLWGGTSFVILIIDSSLRRSQSELSSSRNPQRDC
jgi:hypothetical protein